MENLPPTNDVSSSTFWAMVRKELKHRKTIKDAQEAKVRDRQHFKSLGVGLGDFDYAIKQLLAKDNGEGMIESLRRRKRYLTHLGLPQGTQFNLFDEPKAKPENQSRLDKAYNGGGAAVILGLTEAENPFTEGADDYFEWLRGFRETEEEINKADREMAEADKDDSTDDAAEGTLPAKPKTRGKGAAANDPDADRAGDAEAEEPSGDATPPKAAPKRRGRPPNPDAPKASKRSRTRGRK